MTLDAKIASALREVGTSKAVEAVLADTKNAAAALDAEIASARVDAMSPLLDKDAVTGARRMLDDATFSRDRLTVALTALADRAENLREQERQDAEATERAAALKERDELAEVIAGDGPDLIRRLAALVRDIEASDSRLRAAGLPTESAEAKARGFSGNGQWNGGGLATRFRNINLPLFARPGEAWRFDNGAGVMRYPALDA